MERDGKSFFVQPMISMEKKTEETEAFLYIPDMTGFTEFMTKTSPEKSPHIVEEMLKSITESNQLGLSISDLIGDAVFFFRAGYPPTLTEVIDQSKVISEKFKDQLKAHGSRYNWETNKVEQMHELGIKFIAHYGKVALSNIENHIKLIGVPAIEAHLLLKNSVKMQNYLLATEAFLQVSKMDTGLELFSDGNDRYEHVGEVKYKVLDLEGLPAYTADLPEQPRMNKEK